MGTFQKAFLKFLSDKNSISFIKEINSLVEQSKLARLDQEELDEINACYTFEGQKLTPLSIMIRLAHTIDNPLILIQGLIQMGAEINIDYGYHGDRHPDRPLPPLIEAIQLSTADDQKMLASELSAAGDSKQEAPKSKLELYTDISKLLIKSGASVNKIENNISPLCACYNPSAKEIELKKTNPIIFKALLASDKIDVQEFDIAPKIFIPGVSGTMGFQLLYYIHNNLKESKSEAHKKFIEEDFFKPLFEKFWQSREKIISNIEEPPLFKSQEQLDESFEAGLLFSHVIKYQSSQAEKIAHRIAINDEEHLNKFIKPVVANELIEMLCLAGMYQVPTLYYGSQNKVAMEGFLYHAHYLYPFLNAKADIFSEREKVQYGEKIVYTFAFADFTYKIRHYSFFKMAEKMREGNKRRLGEFVEERPRKQLGEEPASNEVKKKSFKQHYTQVMNRERRQLVTLDPKKNPPVAIFHNEMLCHVKKPIALLSVLDVEKTREKDRKPRDHEFIKDTHIEFINLRDLQRQKHYFYLTNNYIPIVRASSIDNRPVMIHTNDLKALSNIFSDQKDSLKYASMLVDEKLWKKDFAQHVINFYKTSQKEYKKNELSESMLLWSMSMGFCATAIYLLKAGVKVNIELVNDLGILDIVLKKGFLDEANYLLSAGCTPKDKNLLATVNANFGDHAINPQKKNSYTEQDENYFSTLDNRDHPAPSSIQIKAS